MVELISGTISSGTDEHRLATELIDSRPGWRDEFDALREEMGVKTSAVSRFDLRSENAMVGHLDQAHRAISGLPAGAYSLEDEMGRQIWQQELSQEQLIWSKAFPGQPFEMAAATDGAKSRPTHEAHITSESITVLVFAGIEGGTIRIRFDSGSTRQ